MPGPGQAGAGPAPRPPGRRHAGGHGRRRRPAGGGPGDRGPPAAAAPSARPGSSGGGRCREPGRGGAGAAGPPGLHADGREDRAQRSLLVRLRRRSTRSATAAERRRGRAPAARRADAPCSPPSRRPSSSGPALVTGLHHLPDLAARATSRRGRRPADAIVVLGAAQYDGRPSPVFEARLDHAIDLYDAGVAPVLVVTGGKAEGDRTTEAAAAPGLRDRPAASRRRAILVEDAGRSTLGVARGRRRADARREASRVGRLRLGSDAHAARAADRHGPGHRRLRLADDRRARSTPRRAAGSTPRSTSSARWRRTASAAATSRRRRARPRRLRPRRRTRHSGSDLAE